MTTTPMKQMELEDQLILVSLLRHQRAKGVCCIELNCWRTVVSG
jgi:hypothetical protein